VSFKTRTLKEVSTRKETEIMSSLRDTPLTWCCGAWLQMTGSDGVQASAEGLCLLSLPLMVKALTVHQCNFLIR